MIKNKQQNPSRFNYAPASNKQPFTLKKMVLTAISIPSNDILGLGAIGSIGMASVWLSQTFITPSSNPSSPVLVGSIIAKDSSAAVVFITISILLAMVFWVLLAVYTRRATWWFAKKISAENLFPFLEIALVLLFWLPIISFFVLNNPYYQAQILVAGSGAIALASLLFALEDVLRKHWEVEY